MERRTVLLTTDLSPESLRPFAPVAAMARDLGLSIRLLHVVEDVPIAPPEAPFAPPVHRTPLADELKEARRLLAEQEESLGQGFERSSDVVAASNIARAICDYAAENEIGLIALSTHGRTGFRRMVLGSVAESVLRHSRVPVLVFPRHE